MSILASLTGLKNLYSDQSATQSRMKCCIVSSPSSHKRRPGAVARSEASSLGMQAAPSSMPDVRHILSWRLGHENISTAILPLPLIQEEQLSVTGERMCTKYW